MTGSEDNDDDFVDTEFVDEVEHITRLCPHCKGKGRILGKPIIWGDVEDGEAKAWGIAHKELEKRKWGVRTYALFWGCFAWALALASCWLWLQTNHYVIPSFDAETTFRFELLMFFIMSVGGMVTLDCVDRRCDRKQQEKFDERFPDFIGKNPNDYEIVERR